MNIENRRAPTVAARTIERDVANDPVNPAREPAAPLELGDVLVQAEQHHLRDILGPRPGPP
jgi:hypothetical protein